MLRIETGVLRGKVIETVNDPRTRYTPALVRRSLSSMVDFEGKSCLDLCCGSGVVGFEMLSNGASRVTFVDVSERALITVKRNALKLNVLERVVTKKMDARRFLELTTERFDVIYTDPPYELGLVQEILSRVTNVMHRETLLIVQCSKREKPFQTEVLGLKIVKEKDYGDTFLIFLQKI
ncbi:RsmD family RNA methyltransferase [Fervidobacterium thailandense]|uniref:16S rRNA (Guanine(966)-N(2))-methyltransferase RsmD n=1 Tax=Fervidobacterium thailandense TaxID=1008305 RepID=A0A1E3G1N4_9BACT|nr:RsmD family RNA methyltransferase [Fervidobacterium thailandense]ODN30167.1 16S rRNA (guanine(966)-N(2))-methyltransferase RsmD [Fervidobacterium thailandense]